MTQGMISCGIDLDAVPRQHVDSVFGSGTALCGSVFQREMKVYCPCVGLGLTGSTKVVSWCILCHI